MGHEAALFVPSGTMGNQIAMHLHGTGNPGAEVLGAPDSHVFIFEMGGLAALSGMLAQRRAGRRRPARRRHGGGRAAAGPARTARGRKVLLIENSVNMAGGTVYDRARLEPLLNLAKSRNLAAHLRRRPDLQRRGRSRGRRQGARHGVSRA